MDSQDLLHFLHQVQGFPARQVHLVDEGHDRDAPKSANIEKFPGLGLHALGRVDDHDGAIGGGEGPVGVLGEVLMARGIQHVDDGFFIRELHGGGRDGDTPLLLHAHPIGNRDLASLAAPHHAGGLDHP